VLLTLTFGSPNTLTRLHNAITAVACTFIKQSSAFQWIIWANATKWAIACALTAGQTRLVVWLAWTARSARARHHLQLRRRRTTAISRPPRNKAKRSCKTNLSY
jgi:hypothetical protein